ncbi:hypothetical protein K502DRAFT_325632, partial [Neoconidiobolus thromboides FSU 785]
MASSKNYNSFSKMIEYLLYDSIRTNIGGYFGDLIEAFSSNDLSFYTHHAFIDIFWHEWQLYNSNLEKSYFGSKEINQLVEMIYFMDL